MKSKIFALAVMALFFISAVSAFGVSSPYWEGGSDEDMPLMLEIDSSEVFTLNLQNAGGTPEDVVALVEVIEGDDFVSLPEGNDYTIAAGESVNVPVKVVTPTDAAVGDTFSVAIMTKTAPADNAGGVTMGVGANTKFNVVITEKMPGEGISNQTLVWIVVIAAIIVALIVYFLKKKK